MSSSIQLITHSVTDRSRIKRHLIQNKIIPYKCQCCENDGKWLGKSITLQLDHINGIRNDNRIENLRFLCPNCHSIQPTTNRKKTTPIVISENEIVELAKTCKSVRQIILTLNRAENAYTYRVIKDILLKHGVCNIRTDGFFVKSIRRSTRGSKPRPRKVVRPEKNQLTEMVKNTPLTKIGETYGVSDNAIRKWCRNYSMNVRELSPFSKSKANLQ